MRKEAILLKKIRKKKEEIVQKEYLTKMLKGK